MAKSTVSPAKWLAIVREWVPSEPVEVLVGLIKSLVKASGPVRVEGLDSLIAHTDGTTRSGREKFERLRLWSHKMRADPRYWPQLIKRPREVSILIKGILNKSARPLDKFEIERRYSKFREVPPSGLSQELKELARRGEIDRIAQGLYWRKGTAPKRHESQAQQLYRLVHDAPGHRMRNADLAVALNISRQDLETLIFSDARISGAKSRNERPGFDQMLKHAQRHRFDVVMVWAIDRIGRSLIDLLGTIQHLEA